MRTINAIMKQILAIPMTTPKTKHMEPGSNYIQTIHNLILAIMDFKSQRDVALVGVIRARHVPRTENCRRLRPGIPLSEAFRSLTPEVEAYGLVHQLHWYLRFVPHGWRPQGSRPKGSMPAG